MLLKEAFCLNLKFHKINEYFFFKASGQSCINGVCTSSSTAPVSSCPFGDDTLYVSEVSAVLGFLGLSIPGISNCSAGLSYFASAGYSPSGLCLDPRTSLYFQTTCCFTCQRWFLFQIHFKSAALWVVNLI